MPRQALLVLLAVLGLLLAGCDPAVEARYHPTSVEEVFGPMSHVPGVGQEVYELPATPPDQEGEAKPRDCNPPGQVMKAVGMVALREDSHPYRTLEPTPLAAWQEPGFSSPPPDKAYRMYGWQPATTRGAKESLAEPGRDSGLQPGHSIYRGEPTPLGAWRRDSYSWCDDAANLR